jgi:Flp pilus assembly protein TadG
MSASCFSRRPARKRNGYVMVFGTLMIGLILIPAMGLAIDVGLMYTVEAVMSAAADAAAVAGARDLARGTNSQAQLANAQNTATAYFNANFPSGYLWSSNLQVNSVASTSQTAMRTVTTTASIQLPLIFLNMLHLGPQTISTSSTASRRDINVMFVMDRSGSLASSGMCAPLISAAVGFVGKFAQGRDNVGLITFATSSNVDAAPSTNFQPNVANILNGVTCIGATSSAQALWQAYDQLVGLNQNGALNAILFFTDGFPTATTESFPIKGTSTCSDKTNKVGVLTFGGSTLYGLYNPVAENPIGNDQNLMVTGNISNCAFKSNQTNVGDDLSYAPIIDTWGNSLTATGYKSTTTSGAGLAINATNIQNFSTNAADDAAFRIRSGVADPAQGGKSLSNVVIYAIGLNETGEIDPVFMQRVANDPSLSPNPVAAGAQGQFCNAANASQLNDCFLQVASQMLRISQ